MRWLPALLVGCTIDAHVARIPVVDAGADTSTRCPQKQGTATMIDLGDFCIDATETTREQYALFLASSPKNIPGTECVTNLDLAPGPDETDNSCTADERDLTRDVNHPVVCVDWCDAAAYCAWAGKRLCGAIGGGPQVLDDFDAHNDVKRSEWFAACAGGGDKPRVYPYGDDWIPMTCADGAATATSPVGAHAACHGPAGTAQAAIYDLSGNVYEWVNSCQAGVADPSAQACLTRGGFFRTPPDTPEFRWSACAVATGMTAVRNTKLRGRRDDHIGIRCCAR